MRGEEDEAAQRTRVGGGEREEARVVRARGPEERVEPGEVGDGEVVLDGDDWDWSERGSARGAADVLVPTSRSGFRAPAAFVTGQASDASDMVDGTMLTDDVADAQPCEHTDGIHDSGE